MEGMPEQSQTTAFTKKLDILEHPLVESGENTNYSMKDSNGNRINIASSEVVPQDLTGISMNVDNFQEAYDFLLERGFVNPRGDKVTDTSSSKSTSVHAPSGFFIAVTEHLKNRD